MHGKCWSAAGAAGHRLPGAVSGHPPDAGLVFEGWARMSAVGGRL